MGGGEGAPCHDMSRARAVYDAFSDSCARALIAAPTSTPPRLPSHPAGISAGGTFAAALKVAQTAAPGSVLLAMLPDTAERYLSTPLFEGIPEGSDPEP